MTRNVRSITRRTIMVAAAVIVAAVPALGQPWFDPNFFTTNSDGEIVRMGMVDEPQFPERASISWGEKSLLSSYPSFDNYSLRTRAERDTVGNLHFAVSLDEQSSPSSNFDRFVINPAGEVVETHLNWAGVGGRPVVTDPNGRNIYLRPVASANEHGCVDSANYIHLFSALGNISYAKLDPNGNTVIPWKTITSGSGVWNGYVQPVVTNDDMLVATWYRSTEDICAVMSTDGGETWSDIVVLVDRPADVQTTMLKTRVAADGCVHLVYRGYVFSPVSEWVYYTKLYPDWSTVCVGETVFRTSSTWYPFVSLDDAGDLHISFGPRYQTGTTLVYTRLRGDLDLGGAPSSDELLTIVPDQTFVSGSDKVRYALNLPDENGRVHVNFEQGNYGLETDKDLYYIASWRPGDLDGDNDIDLDDFDILAGCLTGPDVTIAPDCEPADLDLDGDVDLADFGLFQTAFTGS
ncbi:MAG: hypothetical protein KAY37_10545 [Phycisphaerae bacterium]|nr:hypothetical protein [Phycisphaerae bacterium]